jgi:hypothetical protein
MTDIGVDAWTTRSMTVAESPRGRKRTILACGIGGRRAKQRTKERRYRASGTTHRRGIGATSVVRYVVAPRRRLDGTAARATHRARLRREGAGRREDGKASWVVGRIVRAAAATRSATAP